MGAVRIGAVGAGKGRAALELGRIDARPLGKIGEADGTIGAGDPHHAIADLEIAYAGLERFGGDLLQLAAELAGGALNADAARGDRGGAAGAEPGCDLVGIALVDV